MRATPAPQPQEKRLLRRWVNAVIIMGAVASGLVLSRKPWEVYKEERLSAQQQIAEMKASEAKREELVTEDAKTKTSLGMEELARKQGYRKPGELPADR